MVICLERGASDLHMVHGGEIFQCVVVKFFNVQSLGQSSGGEVSLFLKITKFS